MAVPVVSKRAKRHADAAQLHRERQEYAGARAELERALAIITRGPPPWSSPITRLRWARGSADLRAGLGEIGVEQGRPDLARRDFEQALREYGELSHPDSDDVSTVLNNLGVVYDKLGRLDASEACLRRAMDIDRRTRRSATSIATGLSNIAHAFQSAGYHAGAARAMEEALRLAGLTPDTLQRLEQERAFHLMTRGGYAEALVALTQQCEALPPNSVEAATCLGNLGQAYAELQRWDDAERYQRLAVEVRRDRQPGSLPLAVALSNLATTLSMRGALTEAHDHLREAVELAEPIAPHSPPLAAMRGNLAGLMVELDYPVEAAALAQRAIDAAPSANRHLVAAYLAAALAYERLDDPDGAERMLEDARRACAWISPLLPELRPVLTMLGLHALRRDDLHTAATRFDEAIAVAESRRAGAAAEPGLELLFGTARAAYHGRIVAAYASRTPGEAEAAFRAAESFRARTLAELLSTVDSPRTPDPAVDEVFAELATVRGELGDLYRRIESGASGPLRDGREHLEQRAEQLRLRLRAMAPDVADRQYPSPCTIPEIQRCLDDTTLLALYEVTDDGVFLWAIRRDRFTFTRLEPDTEALTAAVEEVVAACRAKDGAFPDAALRRLGEWLLRPLSGAFDQLAVCANDILAYLPFEALPLDGAVLADRCVVWSVPSATTVVRFGGRPRNRHRRRDFAGFAISKTAGHSDLHAAPREVQEVAALFPGRAVALVDGEATVAAVMANAPGSRYVHFATHGFISDGRPLYSGLPLAPSGDGYEFLHAYEMFSLDLCAEMVVCSACDTAVGESRTGEGVVGLSYALFAAGAQSVLLSRWEMNDRITKRLMVSFYHELAAGTPIASALRRASAGIRQLHPHPRHWAGFMLLDTTVRRADP